MAHASPRRLIDLRSLFYLVLRSAPTPTSVQTDRGGGGGDDDDDDDAPLLLLLLLLLLLAA